MLRQIVTKTFDIIGFQHKLWCLREVFRKITSFTSFDNLRYRKTRLEVDLAAWWSNHHGLASIIDRMPTTFEPYLMHVFSLIFMNMTVPSG